MCGISGWVDFGRDLRRERETVQAMTDTMACRGPDAEGMWLAPHAAFGHRRLAIIDIEGGRQPMIADAAWRGRGRAHLQRRGLQLQGAAGRAHPAWAPLPHPERHRGCPGGVPRMGRGLRLPAQRHVRLRHLGRPQRGTAARARPHGDQAPVLLPDASRGAVRLRAQGHPGQPARRTSGRRRRPARDPVLRQDARVRRLPGDVRGAARPGGEGAPRGPEQAPLLAAGGA